MLNDVPNALDTAPTQQEAFELLGILIFVRIA
jgi:hypothetical protein